jgi:hypothetical protein
MQNQKLQHAIENYDSQGSYEILWELAFSSPSDMEEVVQQAGS